MNHVVSASTQRLQARAHTAMQQHLGRTPALWVQSPGRVNLIGEHTDYNGGFVLPCAIDFRVIVAAAPRDDDQIRVLACDAPESLGAQQAAIDQFRVPAVGETLAQAPAQQGWANYVRGVVQMLVPALTQSLTQVGIRLPAADLVIAGDVPQGAGLSSSAALEVAVIQAFKALIEQGLTTTEQRTELAARLNPTQMALLAQRAENSFVGCQCGIMDQLISARGQRGHALLIDCRDLSAQPVPMPADLAVMIVHSKVRRGLVDSAYNERRAQCEAAARHVGVTLLRDVSLDDLLREQAALDPVVFRRARHVITENARTQAAQQALTAGDWAELGRLMAASHASMRDDFEITVPKIDALVAMLQQAIGTDGGARMTGGGFGGCAVALLPAHRADAVAQHLRAHYRGPHGELPDIWVTQAVDGAGVLG